MKKGKIAWKIQGFLGYKDSQLEKISKFLEKVRSSPHTQCILQNKINEVRSKKDRKAKAMLSKMVRQSKNIHS